MRSIRIVVAGLSLICAGATTAHTQPVPILGSDPMRGLAIDAIEAVGLEEELVYAGGLSGTAENVLVNGNPPPNGPKLQNIVHSAQTLPPDRIEALLAQGAEPIQTAIALDGVAIWVRADQSPQNISIPVLRDIYLCTIRDWNQVPNSGRSGPITPLCHYNRLSATSELFRSVLGITSFGSCVSCITSNMTDTIAQRTATHPNDIGYASLAAQRAGNRALAVGQTNSGPFVLPSEANIRAFAYPLTRRLFVHHLTGSREPTAAEQALLDFTFDPDMFDPIVEANQLVTCDVDAAGERDCP
jgi:ABC-type phosphate transport system substrate-binding protein